MSEDPNTLVMRFHKKNIVRETEDTVMIQIDDGKKFMEQMIFAFLHPNQAVVKRNDDVS